MNHPGSRGIRVAFAVIAMALLGPGIAVYAQTASPLLVFEFDH